MILICCGIGITVRGFLVGVGWFWPVGRAVFCYCRSSRNLCMDWAMRVTRSPCLECGFSQPRLHFGVVTSPFLLVGIIAPGC